MARRKRKGLGIFRILVLLLLVALIVLVLVLIFTKKVTLEKQTEEAKQETSQNDINKKIKISCNKYDVYFDEDDKLGFNFIIAEIDFETTEGNLYYDLANMHTAEKIKLNECDYYLEKLKSFKYDISKFNLLDYQFSCEGSHLTGNVFIPFKNNTNELSVYNGEGIDFDLKKNVHNINELLYEIKTEDIKTDEYDISISTSYIENMFVTAGTGEEFVCPYALAFELTVNSVSSNNVYIEKAKYIPEGASANDYYDCLDDYVDSYKITNIINKKLKKGDKYGLFFQIFEDTNTSGTIMIKFSDSDKWMELKG